MNKRNVIIGAIVGVVLMVVGVGLILNGIATFQVLQKSDESSQQAISASETLSEAQDTSDTTQSAEPTEDPSEALRAHIKENYPDEYADYLFIENSLDQLKYSEYYVMEEDIELAVKIRERFDTIERTPNNTENYERLNSLLNKIESQGE